MSTPSPPSLPRLADPTRYSSKSSSTSSSPAHMSSPESSSYASANSSLRRRESNGSPAYLEDNRSRDDIGNTSPLLLMKGTESLNGEMHRFDRFSRGSASPASMHADPSIASSSRRNGASILGAVGLGASTRNAGGAGIGMGINFGSGDSRSTPTMNSPEINHTSLRQERAPDDNTESPTHNPIRRYSVNGTRRTSSITSSPLSDRGDFITRETKRSPIGFINSRRSSPGLSSPSIPPATIITPKRNGFDPIVWPGAQSAASPENGGHTALQAKQDSNKLVRERNQKVIDTINSSPPRQPAPGSSHLSLVDLDDDLPVLSSPSLPSTSPRSSISSLPLQYTTSPTPAPRRSSPTNSATEHSPPRALRRGSSKSMSEEQDKARRVEKMFDASGKSVLAGRADMDMKRKEALDLNDVSSDEIESRPVFDVSTVTSVSALGTDARKAPATSRRRLGLPDFSPTPSSSSTTVRLDRSPLSSSSSAPASAFLATPDRNESSSSGQRSFGMDERTKVDTAWARESKSSATSAGSSASGSIGRQTHYISRRKENDISEHEEYNASQGVNELVATDRAWSRRQSIDSSRSIDAGSTGSDLQQRSRMSIDSRSSAQTPTSRYRNQSLEVPLLPHTAPGKLGSGRFERRSATSMDSYRDAPSRASFYGPTRSTPSRIGTASSVARSSYGEEEEVVEDQHHAVLDSALDAFSQHFRPIEQSQHASLSESVALVKSMTTIVNQTMKINTGLRALVRETNEAQIDAALDESIASTSAELARFERGLNSLLRSSDNQLRGLTEGLISFTRVDRERERVRNEGGSELARSVSRAGSRVYVSPSTTRQLPTRSTTSQGFRNSRESELDRSTIAPFPGISPRGGLMQSASERLKSLRSPRSSLSLGRSSTPSSSTSRLGDFGVLPSSADQPQRRHIATSPSTASSLRLPRSSPLVNDNIASTSSSASSISSRRNEVGALETRLQGVYLSGSSPSPSSPSYQRSYEYSDVDRKLRGRSATESSGQNRYLASTITSRTGGVGSLAADGHRRRTSTTGSDSPSSSRGDYPREERRREVQKILARTNPI